MNEMRAPFLQESLQLLLNPFSVLYRCIYECSQQWQDPEKKKGRVSTYLSSLLL